MQGLLSCASGGNCASSQHHRPPRLDDRLEVLERQVEGVQLRTVSDVTARKIPVEFEERLERWYAHARRVARRERPPVHFPAAPRRVDPVGFLLL